MAEEKDIYQNFSVASLQVLRGAFFAAKDRGFRLIGSEHLLMGLLAQENTVASRVLKDAGLSLDDITSKVEEIYCSRRESIYVLHKITLTPRAKRIIILAETIRETMTQSLVQPEQILIALIDESPNVASFMMENTGIDLLKLRSVLLKKMSNNFLGIEDTTIEDTNIDFVNIEEKPLILFNVSISTLTKTILTKTILTKILLTKTILTNKVCN